MKWLALLVLSATAFAQTGPVQNFCVQGATPAAVSGLNSTNSLQGILPSCTVTVYFGGTSTQVPGSQIFANPSGTVLGNPFTASTNGQWLFYSLLGQGVDVAMSTGVTLTGLFPGSGASSPPFPQFGFSLSVGANQGSSDTVLTVSSGITSAFPIKGTFAVGTEWETYTGYNVGTQTFTGITRGVSHTTPAAHSISADVYSVDVPFGDFTQAPTGGVFGFGNGGGNPGQVLSVNCGFPSLGTDNGSSVVFQANCNGAATYIDSAGRIHQQATNSITNFFSPFYVGQYSVDTNSNVGQPVMVANSTNIVQTNGAYQFGQPMGFSNGISGPVISNAVPNLPAPLVGGTQGGSCSITYEVTGVDVDGVTIPGATATAGSLIFPSTGIVYIQVPLTAGVVTYNVYRTAVSACGGTITTGKFTGAQSAQYPLFQDTGGAGDGTSPPGSNTSVAKTCTNGESHCEEAGPGTTPAFSCSSFTRSWTWVNTSATATPFSYVCNGTSFVTAY